MPTSWAIYVCTWTVFAVGVIALALYRKYLARGEYDVLHIRDAESPLIAGQATFARRLETIDHWGKLLTTIAIGYGLMICGAFLYQIWQQSNQ